MIFHSFWTSALQQLD